MSTGRNAKCTMRNTGDRRSATRLSALCILSVAVLTGACSEGANGATNPPEPLAVQIGAENFVSVKAGTIIVGPIISGELTASREATVRAELGGAILDV